MAQSHNIPDDKDHHNLILDKIQISIHLTDTTHLIEFHTLHEPTEAKS